MRIFSVVQMRLVTLVILSGCATVGSKPKVDVSKYTRSVKGQSVLATNYYMTCPKSVNLEKQTTWTEWVKMANGCLRENRWKEVEAIGHRLAQIEPQSPWGVYYLSLAALERQDYRRALWMIDVALAKAPAIGIFNYQKGRVLWFMKENVAALASVEESLRFDSDNVAAHFLLGQIYLRDLDFSKAAEHLSLVFKEKGRDPIVVDQLAYCYFRLKKSKESLELLDLAIGHSPNRVDLRVRQAQIFEEQMKDEEGALELYRKVKSLILKGRLSGTPSFNIDSKIKSLESSLSQRKPATQEKVSLRGKEDAGGEVRK